MFGRGTDWSRIILLVGRGSRFRGLVIGSVWRHFGLVMVGGIIGWCWSCGWIWWIRVIWGVVVERSSYIEFWGCWVMFLI